MILVAPQVGGVRAAALLLDVRHQPEIKIATQQQDIALRQALG